MTEAPSPSIRPYNPATDLQSVLRVYAETAAPSLRSNPPALQLGAYLWCLPYLALSPSTCFVLDSNHSSSPSVVGYIIGTPSTPTFVSAFKEEYVPNLNDPLLYPPKEGEIFDWEEDMPGAMRGMIYRPEEHYLHKDFPNLVDGWPAHLHIDILPEWQRSGWGRALFDRYCGNLKAKGVSGVHLVMAEDNKGAERFYGRVGFERFGEALDGGLNGEVGMSSEKSLWMVKKL